jgi:2,6-dihydroxypyridine 3-monooxygenase
VIREYLPEKVSFGRICLIGDAAHLARPHAGAGATLAMEDSLQLVQSLLFANGDVQKGLEDYESQRIARIRNVVRMASLGGDSQQGIVRS